MMARSFEWVATTENEREPVSAGLKNESVFPGDAESRGRSTAACVVRGIEETVQIVFVRY